MTGIYNDPLLQCLIALGRFHGSTATPASLLSGLPLEQGRLVPSLVPRAASRIGLVGRISRKTPDRIEPALLPAIILLTDERACLLTGWDAQGLNARVIYPDLNEAEVEVPRDQFLAQCTDTVILCRPRFRFDQRAPGNTRESVGHWFWSAMRENLPVYRDVLLAAFFINLFALALPLFVMNVYDRVVPNHAVETLWMLASGVLLVLLADLALRTLRGHFIDLASRRLDVKLSGRIMERVLGMRMEHRPASVGSYAVNLRSFEFVRDFITSASLTTLIDIPFALVFIVVVGWIAPSLLIPILLGLVVVILYALLCQGRLRRLAERGYQAGALRNSTLIEGLVGLDTVKALGAESAIQRKWEKSTSYLADIGVRLRRLSNSTVFVSLWTQQVVTVFVVATGVYMITAGEISMGGLIASTMLTSRIMSPFGQLAGLILHYHNAAIALKSLNEVMRTPLERPEGRQFISRDLLRGDIEFKNVSFAYPGSEVESLSGVSFRVAAGEHVAILGRVGSGKSTLQKLAMGLYQPTDGAVLVDGIDLRQLDPGDLRGATGYVPQDPTLFYGTLRENLTVFRDNVSDEALLRAVDVAGLSEFVNRHPRGFELQIAERGDSLSGGQRKSVALARAVLHEPPILLLDEPTGSMDHSTETAVIEQLRTLIRGRTLMVVTHRNALLRLVDRIIVIDKGRVVADGPRESVMQALQQGKIGKAV